MNLDELVYLLELVIGQEIADQVLDILVLNVHAKCLFPVPSNSTDGLHACCCGNQYKRYCNIYRSIEAFYFGIIFMGQTGSNSLR